MSAVKNPGHGVYYTPGGHWMPTIPGVVCQHCGVEFTAHKKEARFCSRSCSAKATARRVAHTVRVCPGCEKEWSAPKSNSSQYCSKECIYASGAWRKPKRKKCISCGSAFSARWRARRNGYEKHCSHKCASSALVKKVERECKNCGDVFHVQPSRSHEETCSRECANAHYKRDRHHAWQGGKVLQSDRAYRRIDREGYKAKYEGEHRLIVAREIGRPLVRGEVVVCIDGDHQNLSPSNLFLCPNQKEFGLIRNGAVEWPTSSNLEQMRSNGYERPDVIITLHEWEDGKRRENPWGKPITRHPQADEIIKRRKAGATARELAAEFSTNLSNMSAILRRRL